MNEKLIETQTYETMIILSAFNSWMLSPPLDEDLLNTFKCLFLKNDYFSEREGMLTQ